MRGAKAVAALGVVAAVMASGCAGQAGSVRPLATRLEARLVRWSERGGVPAATVVVRRSGEVVWEGARGTGAQAQMRVASITKMFAAATALLLVEEGAVDLDADLPPRAAALVQAPGLTLRHLLSHTSGLPDYGDPDFSQGLIDDRARVWTDAAVLETVAGERPAFPPGRWWEYSNTNYVAVASVIEEVTGSPWWSLLRTRILDPLGLTATYVAGVESPRGSGLVAEAFFDLDNDGDYEDVERGAWPALETSESAAGAIVSTAGDVAAFTEALFSGRVVGDAALREMVMPGPYRRRYDAYGLGVELRRPDLTTTVWGHGGLLPGYRSVTWFVPASDTTVTVLANHALANPGDLAEQLLRELG